MRERHEPDQVGKGEDGVEDDEEGGEDCPEELKLNRHGDYSDYYSDYYSDCYSDYYGDYYSDCNSDYSD